MKDMRTRPKTKKREKNKTTKLAAHERNHASRTKGFRHEIELEHKINESHSIREREPLHRSPPDPHLNQRRRRRHRRHRDQNSREIEITRPHTNKQESKLIQLLGEQCSLSSCLYKQCSPLLICCSTPPPTPQEFYFKRRIGRECRGKSLYSLLLLLCAES